jgi:hypothetical protein
MGYIILELVLCVVVAGGIAALGFACALVGMLVDEGIAHVFRAKSRAPQAILDSIVDRRALIGKRSGVSGTGPEGLFIR